MALAAAPVEEAAEPDDKLFMTTQKEPREATAAPTPGPQPVFEDEEEQQEDDGPPAEDEDEAFSSDDEGERSRLLSAALSLGLRLPIQPSPTTSRQHPLHTDDDNDGARAANAAAADGILLVGCCGRIGSNFGTMQMVTAQPLHSVTAPPAVAAL